MSERRVKAVLERLQRETCTTTSVTTPLRLNARNFQAPRHLRDLSFDLFVRLLESRVRCGNHQVERHLESLGSKKFRIDRDLPDLALTSDRDRDLVRAGCRRDFGVFDVGLCLVDFSLHPGRLTDELVHSTAKLHEAACMP